MAISHSSSQIMFSLITIITKSKYIINLILGLVGTPTLFHVHFRRCDVKILSTYLYLVINASVINNAICFCNDDETDETTFWVFNLRRNTKCIPQAAKTTTKKLFLHIFLLVIVSIQGVSKVVVYTKQVSKLLHVNYNF